MKLILASASPRRKELLEQIGLKFQIIPAKGEEVITDSRPEKVVQELSQQKAREVLQSVCGKKEQEDLLVIGADTVVSFSGQILGKPKDEKEAEAMLTMLQGQTHQVYTGVTLLCRRMGKEERITFYNDTSVTMYPMDQRQILSYIATGEPMDKAGSYGIQGRCAAFIKEIKGDYNNVVGLPVSGIYQQLLKLGIDISSIS